MNIVLKIIFGLIGLLFLVNLGFQLMSGYMVYSVVSKVNNGVNGESKNPFPEDISVENAKRGPFYKDGFKALSKFDELEAPRRIEANIHVQKSEFLKPGETGSHETQSVLIAARASKIAREECNLITQTLATKCKIKYSEAKLQPDGNVRVKMRFYFTQRPDFGSYDKNKKLFYQEVDQILKRKHTTLRLFKSYRKKMYTEVFQSCKRLKKREGNCAITSISIDSYLNKGARSGRISGKYTLSLILN